VNAEKVEKFSLLKMEQINKKLDRIANQFGSMWDRHVDVYEEIDSIIQEELIFSKCQDAADMKFMQLTGDWDRIYEEN
jgi:hypothetical protein